MCIDGMAQNDLQEETAMDQGADGVRIDALVKPSPMQ